MARHDSPGQILFLSDFPLGFHNAEPEEKLSRFAARGWDAVYVEKIGIRDPGPRNLGAALRRLNPGARSGSAGDARPFRTISPKILPARRAAPIAALNRRWLNRQLLGSLGDPGAAIAWVRYPAPEIVRLLDDMQPRLTIYEAVDLHTESPGLPRRLRVALANAEDELLERAGVVFAWSEPIRAHLARARDGVLLAPAAADLDRFAAAAESEPAPRTAVYTGSLDFRFDAELVAAVAQRLPDWTFVLAGPVLGADSAGPLGALPNVELQGTLAADEVPALLGSAAVCLMPYRRTPFNDTLFPIKLVEYVAAGRPVVSTPIAAARQFGDAVLSAEGVEAFAAAIERAAADDSPDARRARAALAEPYSWDARIDEMERAIERALADG